jgi:diguanylate cyclase (GGDEF)-like protein
MSRILLLTENKRNQRLLEELLSRNFEVVPSNEKKPLAEEKFDLAIIDGPCLKRLRSEVEARRKAEEPVILPFLLLSVRRVGTSPLRHLGKRVDDLIFRPLDRIEVNARVANLLRLREMSLGLKKQHDLVLKLAVTDDVSGFHNTRFLHRYLDRRLASFKADDGQLSLVFFDIDDFKEVVETHGHLLGSKVLREIAQTVDRVLSPDDRIVRYGGDEFIVILPRHTKEQALVKVELMREAINSTAYLHKEELDVRVTASFGLATYPLDATDKRELLVQADRCLFRSKRRGKNTISVTKSGATGEISIQN